MCRGIRVEEMSLHEFESLFRKKYLCEKYYDDRAKEFYEFKMGSIMEEKYMSKFLYLLMYIV